MGQTDRLGALISPADESRATCRTATYGFAPFLDVHRVQAGDVWQVVEVGVFCDDPVGAHALQDSGVQEVAGAYARMVVRQRGRHVDIRRIDGFNAVVHDLGESVEHLATQRPPARASFGLSNSDEPGSRGANCQPRGP